MPIIRMAMFAGVSVALLGCGSPSALPTSATPSTQQSSTKQFLYLLDTVNSELNFRTQLTTFRVEENGALTNTVSHQPFQLDSVYTFAPARGVTSPDGKFLFILFK